MKAQLLIKILITVNGRTSIHEKLWTYGSAGYLYSTVNEQTRMLTSGAYVTVDKLNKFFCSVDVRLDRFPSAELANWSCLTQVSASYSCFTYFVVYLVGFCFHISFHSMSFCLFWFIFFVCLFHFFFVFLSFSFCWGRTKQKGKMFLHLSRVVILYIDRW